MRLPVRLARPLLILSTTLILSVMFVWEAAAATYTVDTIADTSDAALNGICQTSGGACSLRAAMQEANAFLGTDTILFDSTLFATPKTITLTNDLPDIDSSMIIDGPGDKRLTIDGSDNHTPFLILSGTVTIRDLTIQDGEGASGWGGAISIDGGNVALTNIDVTSGDGYGVYNSVFATTTITGCAISDSSSTGIFNTGVLTVINSAIRDNGGNGIRHDPSIVRLLTITNSSITGNAALEGAGIWSGGDTEIYDSSIAENSAVSTGGGVYIWDGSVTLTNSTISENSAVYGGGVYNQLGNLTAIDSLISGNEASNSGGAIFNKVDLIVQNSTVIGNTAALNGGGIFNQASAWVINSTFSGNISDEFGGGLYNQFEMSVINSTFSGNSAFANRGGGLYTNTSATTVLYNSIFANSPSGGDCIRDSGTFSSHYSLFETSTPSQRCGITAGSNGNVTGVDPALGTLTDNGGVTETMALQPGSPAINAGSNALAEDAEGDPLTTDQRGTSFPRILGGTVDIGAYEVAGETLNVQLVLQGRSEPAPHPSRVVTVHVRIMPSSGGAPFYTADFTTDQNSAFTVPNVPLGTYLFSFKGTHTLARQATLTIISGTNIHTTAMLREGDADDNNGVVLPDFSLLAASFGKSQGQAGYDARADFNGDNVVNLIDFSLLASNFGTAGEGGIYP